MPQIPEWVAATIRYLVTIAGVLLVANDVIEQSLWDESVATLVALLTALYGVIRTREIEAERDDAVLDLRIAKTMRSV